VRAGALAIILLFVAACEDRRDLEAEAAACAEGPPLALPGVDGHLVALNAYYLQEEATRALRRGDPEAAAVEETLAKASALGVRALRTNAFNDGPRDTAMQVAPLVYDEVALRGLDLVLARARVYGLRLVLPLANRWDDYGGQRQYVAWAGLPAPREGDPRFFTERAVVEHFRAHVAALLDRVSTVDGLRWGDHPAVLAWELVNEPRAEGVSREALRAWVDELAALVKAKAPGHLVGSGEEGLDGEEFALLTASPHLDYASVHLYPEAWGVPADWAAFFGAGFLSERIATARRLGKPLLVGELALRNDGLPLEDRRAIYRGWFRCIRAAGGAGVAPWLFAYDARPDAWDPHTFYWRDGTDPADPVNRYADLVRDAAAVP
jgi:mannan endo-1,4-beta-mannosidase